MANCRVCDVELVEHLIDKHGDLCAQCSDYLIPSGNTEVQTQQWLVEYEGSTWETTVSWDGKGKENPKKEQWVEIAADGWIAAAWQHLQLDDGDRITLKLTAPSSQCFKLQVLVQVEARAVILGSVDVTSDAL